MSDVENDPAYCNVPMSGRRGKALDAEITRNVKRIQAEKRAAERERSKAIAAKREADRAAEMARVKFTAADLANASHVRNEYGWHRVVRVSARSVTVETPYSWTERIPLDKVLGYAIDGKAATS